LAANFIRGKDVAVGIMQRVVALLDDIKILAV